eukprot:GHVR01059993.1.p1 GENE.GHVR01059993.1~~GHVR01059993.1.p1  ORF type:complete len:246 (-),score=52.95 GHVR01059993.1:188-925(-)
MKLNIANTSGNVQKSIEIDDDRRLLPFFDKRMGAEVPGDSLGDEYKGYVFKVTGGNDKQGFPMMQGVLLNHRTRLLFKKGMKTFRERRKGSFKRKSVRGCIVGSDLSVLNLVIASKGESEVPGLTDVSNPARLGRKRATRIRKLFGLHKKDDDVRKYVVRRQFELKSGKTKVKAPKIQRLVTKVRLQRKRRERALKVAKCVVSRQNHTEYTKMVQQYNTTQKEKRMAELSKKKNEVAKKKVIKNV